MAGAPPTGGPEKQERGDIVPGWVVAPARPCREGPYKQKRGRPKPPPRGAWIRVRLVRSRELLDLRSATDNPRAGPELPVIASLFLYSNAQLHLAIVEIRGVCGWFGWLSQLPGRKRNPLRVVAQSVAGNAPAIPLVQRLVRSRRWRNPAGANILHFAGRNAGRCGSIGCVMLSSSWL